MAGVNKVILVGNLGKDPEVRSMQNGNKVCSFSVATSDSWKDRDGNRQERTEWHNVVVFNEGLVGVLERYTRKGSKVYLEGKLQTRKWKDQSGADRWSTEVVLQNFDSKLVLLDSKRDDDGGSSGGYSSGSSGGGYSGGGSSGGGYGGASSGGSSYSQRPAPAFDSDLDDDVPFITSDMSLEGRCR